MSQKFLIEIFRLDSIEKKKRKKKTDYCEKKKHKTKPRVLRGTYRKR